MIRDYRQIFAICKKHGWNYKDKVAEFTGTHDSLSRLTDREYHEFLMQMIKVGNGANPNFRKKPGDKQRKKLIALALAMFWGKNSEEAVEEVDQWIRKQKFKKPLMKHTPAELDLMVAVMEERVYPDYLEGLRK